MDFFNSEDMFKNSIPFKIYKLEGFSSGVVQHSHNYIQIWYIRSGVCSHWINGKEYRMVKGDIFVLPPYLVHSVRPVDGEKLVIIGCEFSMKFINGKFGDLTKDRDFFDFAYIEPFLVSEDMVKPKLNLSGDVQVQVESAMEDMLNEFAAENKYYEMLIKADLLRLLVLIARQYGNAPQNNEYREIFDKYRSAIIESINYIQENFDKEIRLDEICKYSMLSKTYFCYIFKSLTGKTFTEYLINLRIQKAQDLLVNTHKPITDICFDIGFNDVTYFCRTFKKVTGTSPRHYRSSVIEK